jgi:hypothetical protein
MRLGMPRHALPVLQSLQVNQVLTSFVQLVLLQLVANLAAPAWQQHYR